MRAPGRRGVFRLLLFQGIAPLALRANAPSAGKVEELLRLTSGSDNFLGTLESDLSRLESSLRVSRAKGAAPAQPNLPTKEKQVLDVRNRVAKLKSDLTKAYTDVFTEAEIDGILAFYRSPAGRAMVQKYPQLMVRVKTVRQQQMLLDAEIRKLLDEPK